MQDNNSTPGSKVEPLTPEQLKQAHATETTENPKVADAASPEDDFDAPIPFEELPASQFDNTGAVVQQPVTGNPVEQTTSTQLLSKLTPDQRKYIQQNNPFLYQALEAETKDTDSMGRARYERHPLRPRTDVFSENALEDYLSLFSQQGVRDIADRLLSLDLSNPRHREWFDSLGSALKNVPAEDFGIAALNRPESEWVQSIDLGERKKIYCKSMDLPKAPTGPLKGEKAVAYAAAVSGAGRPCSMPLMSSGWTAWFRPATNSEWARFYEVIMEARNKLGRSTIGVGFSASRAVYIEEALNFAVEHLTGTSFRMPSGVDDRSSILRYLSVNDIDAFLVGFLVATHPDGYALRMPCFNGGANRCSAEQSLDANLRTMMVYDRRAFAEHELYHMLRSGIGESTLESVASYQANLRTNQSQFAEIKTSQHTQDKIAIEFGPCSAYDYIASSKRYIERVTVGINNLVSDKVSQQRRIEIINGHYWQEPMRDYGHLVKSIRIGDAIIEVDPDNKENPRADIEDYLTRASESDTMRTEFRKAAIAYQNRSITSMLAVPGYTCPSCGYKHDLSENDRFLNCIPVDVPTVFFSRALLRFTELVGR